MFLLASAPRTVAARPAPHKLSAGGVSLYNPNRSSTQAARPGKASAGASAVEGGFKKKNATFAPLALALPLLRPQVSMMGQSSSDLNHEILHLRRRCHRRSSSSVPIPQASARPEEGSSSHKHTVSKSKTNWEHSNGSSSFFFFAEPCSAWLR